MQGTLIAFTSDFIPPARLGCFSTSKATCALVYASGPPNPGPGAALRLWGPGAITREDEKRAGSRMGSTTKTLSLSLGPDGSVSRLALPQDSAANLESASASLMANRDRGENGAHTGRRLAPRSGHCRPGFQEEGPQAFGTHQAPLADSA